MKIPEAFLTDAQAMPKVLRALLEAELTAGNEIIEVFHRFPAPPAGACFRLARPVTTRPRSSGGGIDFYDRNSSSYSGEFTDAKRFYFIIEPPKPPPPEPDMDAIRARSSGRMANPDVALPPRNAGAPKPETALQRFERSMVCNYEKWHDGVGYDLGILKTAAPEELVEIENRLVGRGINDWRDVEALAALNSPRARVLLRKALTSGNHEISTAVISYAPDLVSNEERTRMLVAALISSKTYEDLTQTLLEVEEFHPPKIVEALLRGVLNRDSETAMQFAAMLMFIHGKATCSFDWELRPFFLKFLTDDRAERKALYLELCARIGLKPGDEFAAGSKTG